LLGIDSDDSATTLTLSWQDLNNGAANQVAVGESGVIIVGKDISS